MDRALSTALCVVKCNVFTSACEVRNEEAINKLEESIYLYENYLLPSSISIRVYSKDSSRKQIILSDKNEMQDDSFFFWTILFSCSTYRNEITRRYFYRRYRILSLSFLDSIGSNSPLKSELDRAIVGEAGKTARRLKVILEEAAYAPTLPRGEFHHRLGKICIGNFNDSPPKASENHRRSSPPFPYPTWPNNVFSIESSNGKQNESGSGSSLLWTRMGEGQGR